MSQGDNSSSLHEDSTSAASAAPAEAKSGDAGGRQAPQPEPLSHKALPVVAWWPTLNRARTCMASAAFEPPWLTGAVYDGARWIR
jgi:hypothetical protein